MITLSPISALFIGLLSVLFTVIRSYGGEFVYHGFLQRSLTEDEAARMPRHFVTYLSDDQEDPSDPVAIARTGLFGVVKHPKAKQFYKFHIRAEARRAQLLYLGKQFVGAYVVCSVLYLVFIRYLWMGLLVGYAQ